MDITADAGSTADALTGADTTITGTRTVAASLLATPKPSEGGWEARLSVHNKCAVRRPQGDGYSYSRGALTAVISALLLF